ncbi:hypothetical protein TorRG33x02_050100 [Trema orientale]|uniref:Uncharacterized protein n=1 Tax=Trema orientale TaxID=63057 RepID=A0A2P5FN06_TREOI|nr:hypothetical protein TorRG33x02_050100 [Trema orientale]
MSHRRSNARRAAAASPTAVVSSEPRAEPYRVRPVRSGSSAFATTKMKSRVTFMAADRSSVDEREREEEYDAYWQAEFVLGKITEEDEI